MSVVVYIIEDVTFADLYESVDDALAARDEVYNNPNVSAVWVGIVGKYMP
jgi:hypothetical protein